MRVNLLLSYALDYTEFGLTNTLKLFVTFMKSSSKAADIFFSSSPKYKLKYEGGKI